MWIYEKKLQYPVKIKTPNPRLAQIIISQLGGPDGEIGASMRYLNQRYSMPEKQVAGLLTDIGTEELAHVEMVSAILYQLTRNLPADEIAASPFATYFVDHTTGVYPIAASGVPFDAKYIGVKGDPIADLNEDLAAEQKARVTYDNILRRMCATPSSSCVNGRLSIISALPMLCVSRRRGLTDVISTPATLPTIRAVPCSHPAGRAAVAADVPADKPRPERYRRVRAIFTRLFVPLSGRKGGFQRAGEGKGTSAGKSL